MNKRNLMFFTVMSFIVIFIVSAFVGSEEKSEISDELPYRYEIYNFNSAGGNSSGVQISTRLYPNEDTIPIRGDKMKIGFFPSSGDSADFVVRDSGDDWKSSITFHSHLVNGEREEYGVWESGKIMEGESVILLDGEEATLLGYDNEGPLFKVVD